MNTYSFGDKELIQLLHLMIDKIMKANPTLKLDDKRKNELVEEMRVSLKSSQYEIGKQQIQDPQFMNKLFMLTCMLLTAEKNKALLVPIKALFEKFKPDPNKKLSLKDIKDKLSPQELKMALMLLQELRTKMKDNCKKCKLPEPKPSTPDDDMSWLLGVISKHIAGGHAVVVQRNPGNLMGIVDVSPNFESSTAPIDADNKLSDTGFGDPLGLNDDAKERFKSSSFVDESMMGEIRQVTGLTPGNIRK